MFASYRRLSRNTFILAGSIGSVLLAFFAWNSLLPLYMRELGANDVEIGIAFSLFILVHTVPAVAGGILADRVGRKWLILGPGFILTPLYILAGLTTDWRVLTLILIGTNAAGAVQWPAMQAMISESDEETRATAFSLIEIFVLSASVAGPLLGAALLPWVGVGGLIMLHGFIMALATGVRWRELKETHVVEAHEAPVWKDRGTAITRPILWIIVAYTLASLALGLSAGGPFMAIMSHDVWGLTEQQIQQVMAVSSLAAFGGIWLGSRADRWGARRMWFIAAAGFAITLVGWGLSPNAWIGVWFVAFNNLFFEAVFIISETVLAHYTTRTTRSFIFGLMGTVGGVAEAVGPTIGTGLINLWRLPATFLAGAAVGTASLVALAPIKEPTREAAVTAGQVAD
ncbi:MAG: MFS transporter [Anaerolineae bacterium]